MLGRNRLPQHDPNPLAGPGKLGTAWHQFDRTAYRHWYTGQLGGDRKPRGAVVELMHAVIAEATSLGKHANTVTVAHYGEGPSNCLTPAGAVDNDIFGPFQGEA